MSYIGNTLQAAFPSYLNIDDISGSFNGVTTSFALTVGGVAPVPAPTSSNQCLISVGGVVQRPDDTGTEGFRLSGGNIIFSSAPGTGEDFFGVVLAGADYLNVGANFPSGTAANPSITFDTDLDTGIYNSAANELSFTTAGVNKLTLNSSGDVVITDKISHLGDTNTAIRFPAADTVSVETDGNERARIDSSGRLLVGTSTARTMGTTIVPSLQAEGTSNNTSALALVQNNSGATLGASVTLAKTRATGNGGTTVVQSGENLGSIYFEGADGTNLVSAARISAAVDGTPGANDMPGRLVFSTTADGASSPTERMRIDSSGRVEIGAAIGAGANVELYAKTNTHYQAIFGWADGSGTAYGGLFQASAGNSTQYGVYGYVNTSSIYASGGSLAYSINLNTYAICGYWSGASYWSLYGNGAVGATAFTNVSDSRLKDVDSTLTGCLDKLASIQPVKYTWKENSQQRRSMGDRLEIGLLAEEVQAQFPELVSEMEWGKVTGANPETLNEQLGTTLGVDYGRMTAVLIQALNEAKERIETLEARITALETA